ncbi:MAG: DUF4296 domain-containing protein [Bacteroidales bacterium]|nr:DUF4296 domain-containing protein [Bacteroidales bacterium]
MKKTALLLPLLLLVAACHRNPLPDGVLDHGQMTAFLADAYLQEGIYAVGTRYRYDTMPDRLYQGYDSILEAHGITRRQVELSLDYYSHHLDAYQAIQDSVVARLEARAAGPR